MDALIIEIEKLKADFGLKDGFQSTPFYSLLKYSTGNTILELKTWHEGLTFPKYLQFIGKAITYLSLRVKFPSQVKDYSLTLVSTRRPKWLFHAKEIKIKKERNGIYKLVGITTLPLHLFIVNELEVTKENYGLLFLSSGATRDSFIRTILLNYHKDKLTQEYYDLMFFYFNKDVIRIMEAENMSASEISVNIKRAVELVGLRKVIEEVGLRKVIEEVGLRKVIEEVGLEQIIEEIGIEELERKLQQIKRKRSGKK